MSKKRVRLELTIEMLMPPDPVELAALSGELLASLTADQMSALEALASAVTIQRSAETEAVKQILRGHWADD